MNNDNKNSVLVNNEFDKNSEINSNNLDNADLLDAKTYNTQKIQEEMLKITKKQKKPKNFKSILSWVLMSFLLVFWLLIVIRVPYVGTFFDGIVFEFFFGWTKYIIYMLTWMLILSLKFDILRNYFFSKRKIIWYLLLIIAFSIMLNIVHFYYNGYTLQSYSELYYGAEGYINKWYDFFWLSTTKSFNVSYVMNLMPQYSSWGGLLGLFVVSSFTFISPIILLIILIFILIIFGIKLFNKKRNIKSITKTRNWIIRKLGGFTKEEINIKLGQSFNDQIDEEKKPKNKSKKPKLGDSEFIPVIKTVNTVDVFNDEKFSDINFINNVLARKLKKKFNLSNIEQSKNLLVNYKFEKLDNLKQKINQFIKLHDYAFEFISDEIRLQSIKLKYSFSNFEEMLEIKNSESKLLDLVKEKQVITYISKDNELVIEVVIKESSQATLHEELANSKAITPYNVPIGKDDKFNSEYINLINKTNLLIYGCVGSGKSMGLSAMLSYLLAISNKTFLKCEIIDLTNKTLKVFSNIDNNYLTYKSSEDELLKSLDYFVNKIQEYKEIISNRYSNIYEYNDSVIFDKIIKNQVIVINEINLISNKHRVDILQKVIYLLKHAKKFGFIVIVTSSEINDDIKQLEKYTNGILYFKLDEKSSTYLDDNSSEAKYLFGKGDLLLSLEGTIYKLQSFIIKKDEIFHLFNIEE